METVLLSLKVQLVLIKSQSALVEYPLEFLVWMYNPFFLFQWKVGVFLPALFYTSIDAC